MLSAASTARRELSASSQLKFKELCAESDTLHHFDVVLESLKDGPDLEVLL